MATSKKTTTKAAAPKKTATPKAKASKPKVSKAKPATTTKEEPIAAQAAAHPHEDSGAVMERGDLFFFYRPAVGEEAPHGLLDVRRFHLVLRPDRG